MPRESFKGPEGNWRVDKANQTPTPHLRISDMVTKQGVAAKAIAAPAVAYHPAVKVPVASPAEIASYVGKKNDVRNEEELSEDEEEGQ